MKSPQALAARLAQQWHSADWRERQLLCGAAAWPLVLPIGAPGAADFLGDASVLRGHLEAMLDGVYPLDSAHVAVAHDQTIHLARLVEDLRVLTLAEAKDVQINADGVRINIRLQAGE